MSDSTRLVLVLASIYFMFVFGMVALMWVFRSRIARNLGSSALDDDDAEFPEEEEPIHRDTVRKATPAKAQKAAPEADVRKSTQKAAPEAPVREIIPEADAEPAETEAEAPETEDTADELSGLYSQPGTGGDVPEEKPAEASAAGEETVSPITHVGDILDCVYLMGRTLQECGISEDFLSADGTEVPVDGSLFDGFASGGLMLLSETLKEPVIDSFYAVSSDLGYPDCLEALAERFGEPVAEGEEESADGNTVYAAFLTDFGTVWLSRKEGNDYLNLNLMRDGAA